MKIGILGAMLEEIDEIQALMHSVKKTRIAGREYIEGFINNIEIVLVFSKWGKVASSITTTTLINNFHTNFIIFTGVAGAINKKLNIGDIIIGEGLYQHDMDARPFFDQFQIPLSNNIIFKPKDLDMINMHDALENFVRNINSFIDRSALLKFGIDNPKIYKGLIASGDKFVTNGGENLLNNTLCVEMEGAVVAQVCDEHKISYLVVRIISDNADHEAVYDFQDFITNIASKYSYGIIQEYFNMLN